MQNTDAAIALGKGKKAIVDADDLDLVASQDWKAVKGATTWYAKAGNVSMHRLIMGNPACEVDHKNGNGLDNRRCNLRLATRSQQTCNSKKPRRKRPCSSRFKGVYLADRCKTKPWRAYITINGKTKVLGYFLTEQEAAVEYDRAAIEAWGEFACPNFAASWDVHLKARDPGVKNTAIEESSHAA